MNKNTLTDQSDNFYFKWANERPMNKAEKTIAEKGVFFLDVGIWSGLLIFGSIFFLNIFSTNEYNPILSLVAILALFLSVVSFLFMFWMIKAREEQKSISAKNTIKIIEKTNNHPKLKSNIINLYKIQGLITIEQELEINNLINQNEEQKAKEKLEKF